MPRFNLPRPFRLPSPVDLGWSEHNALGMREMQPYHEGKTWEDWDDYCRKHHPVLFFLWEVLPLWFKLHFLWPIERVKDWILDHTVRRYHFLDLRGIDKLHDYRHGYIDPCEVFRLAGWASLMRWYRESERHGHLHDPRSWATEEQLAEDEGLRDQRDRFVAACELVKYWTITRIEQSKAVDALWDAMEAIKPTQENKPIYDAAHTAWYNARMAADALEREQWLKLAAIRESLWD